MTYLNLGVGQVFEIGKLLLNLADQQLVLNRKRNRFFPGSSFN
jgi:hypothetical protein